MRLSSIAGATALLLALGGTARAQQLPIDIDEINLVNPQLNDGVLTAASGTVKGTLAGLPFTTDITNFELDLTPDEDGEECAILSLELAPIHLTLLGLHVDTSAICLEITADPEGGLLGDLLCGLADLGLDDLLDQLLGSLENLNGESLLGTILAQALGDALDNGQRQRHRPGHRRGDEDSVCTGDCPILELALGPVDLSLLGLNVLLDDCEGGPVLVCVSATRSEGILGALLCSLAGPRLPGLDLGDIAELIDLAQELLEDGDLSNRDRQLLRQLLRRLIRE